MLVLVVAGGGGAFIGSLRISSRGTPTAYENARTMGHAPLNSCMWISGRSSLGLCRSSQSGSTLESLSLSEMAKSSSSPSELSEARPGDCGSCGTWKPLSIMAIVLPFGTKGVWWLFVEKPFFGWWWWWW